MLLASLYNPAETSTTTRTADGTVWCDTYETILKADKTEAVLSTNQGLNGHSKCTYLIQTLSGSQAPQFKITSADYVNFLVQWVEWADSSYGFTTAGKLTGGDMANYHIGAYGTGFFLNPLITNGLATADVGWPNTLQTYSMYDNPSSYLPGDLGEAIYKSNYKGPYQATQTIS